jgi:lipopolysaccharide export system permease protein
MQFFWLYIDDLVGKGLDLLTIFQLIGLVSVSIFTTALPLSLLFSSIMTFGNLGESFELIAIKAAGIPLVRFMRPLFIFTIFLSGIAFLFSNNIIPVTQLKLTNLKFDIIVAKPAIDIKEGVFYDKIDGYVIKLGKKESNDSIIRNIVIFEKRFNLQDNMIIAESGVMRVTANKKFLEFILFNGWRYQERGQKNTTNTEFTRLYFKEYKKVFDLNSFQMNKEDEINYDPKMLNRGTYDVGFGESRSFEDVMNIMEIPFTYHEESSIPEGYQFYTCSDKSKWMPGWKPKYNLEEGLKNYFHV